MTWIIIISIVILIFIYILVQYNGFVKLTNMVEEAFSTMDVYLKKRWDLIPNLVEAVKGYAKHEKDVLEEVAKLRNLSYDKMNLTDKINTNEKLNGELSRVMILAENYPDLKASENFSALSKQLIQIEDEIANSRKYYNAVVRKYNTKIQMFPSNIIAKIFGFNVFRMFEAGAEERNNTKVEI